MIDIEPIKLEGDWEEGYALDVHTKSSTFLGHDEYGHPRFDNKRSQIGELLYKLKYKSDTSIVGSIAKTVVKFVQDQNWALDFVAVVPPSKARKYQPVVDLADKISTGLGIKFCNSCIVRVKNTPELKSVYDQEKRLSLLDGAFAVDVNELQGKSVLLVDDLFRSGASASKATSDMLTDGKAGKVYLIAITKTKKN